MFQILRGLGVRGVELPPVEAVISGESKAAMGSELVADVEE